MSQIERKRLETFTDDLESDNQNGMSLHVRNVEGGNDSIPDESEFYDDRYSWLQETDGGTPSSIWRYLAKGEFKNVNPNRDNDEKLVYIKMPGWFANKEDDLRSIFNVNDGSMIQTFGVYKPEQSEDSKAYAFTRFYEKSRSRWESIKNQYSMTWVPRKLCTLYEPEGEPRPVDKEEIYRTDALSDEIDVYDAEPDDYDWRLALGAAYKRSNDTAKSELTRAMNNAEELPDKLYKKVEVGVDEYMRQKERNGENVDDRELAVVINSLTAALEPGSVKKGNLL